MPPATPFPSARWARSRCGGDRGITLFAGYLDDAHSHRGKLRRRLVPNRRRARATRVAGTTSTGGAPMCLKVAGENVSTVEVEQVLARASGRAGGGRDRHARLDPRRGASGLRRRRPTPSQPPTCQQLFDWCTERLAKSKLPRRHHVRRRVAEHQRWQDSQVPVERSDCRGRGNPMTDRPRTDSPIFWPRSTSRCWMSTRPAPCRRPATPPTSSSTSRRDALFDHEWLCVGRVEQVAAAGDYFTTTVNSEPI